MIMETKSRSITAMVMLVILLAGCYPQGPEYVEDLDVVITDYEPSYDFGAKGTYALPDRIVKITGDVVEGDEPQFIPDVTATAILAQIDKNMLALGWTKVPYNDSPRCAINTRCLGDNNRTLLLRLLVLVVRWILSILGLGISVLFNLFHGDLAHAYGRSGCSGCRWTPGHTMGRRDQWYFDVLL